MKQRPLSGAFIKVRGVDRYSLSELDDSRCFYTMQLICPGPTSLPFQRCDIEYNPNSILIHARYYIVG